MTGEFVSIVKVERASYLGRILEFKPFEALVDDIRDYWKSDNRGSFALIQWASGVRYQNIADRPESALHRFGTALGSLIKAPSVNRGLLTPLITGAAGLQRSTEAPSLLLL